MQQSKKETTGMKYWYILSNNFEESRHIQF